MVTPSRRVQAGSIFLCYGVSGIFWGALVATLPDFRVISGLGEAAFGLLLAALSAGGIVAMQILGPHLHRVERWAIPAGLLLMATAMIVLGFADGAPGVAAGLLIAGAASGALDISMNMRVSRIETAFGSRLFNRVHALFPFAMLVTSAATGWYREAGAAPVEILPPLALALFFAAGIEARAGAVAHPPDGSGPGATTGPRLARVIVLLGLLAALGATMEGGAHVWSAVFTEAGLGGSPVLGGLAAAAITLGLTAGRLTAHALEERMRDMDIVRLGAVVALPGIAILWLAAGPWMAVAGFFLAGLGIGPVEPAVFRSVARRFGEAARGRALARATGLAYLGYLSAPPLLGAVAQGFGWSAMWLTLGLVALLVAVLAPRIPPAAP